MLRVEEIKLLNGKVCSLTLEKGEFLQVVGPNGIGKSLLLKSLARLIPAQSKELSLDNRESLSFSPSDWRSQLMYIPPEVVFDPSFTILDFFNEPFQFAKYKDFKKTFEPTDFWKASDALMSQLSSGQKQQVALLRALSLNPKILLLDEPFGYMDLNAREIFLNLLKNWTTEDKGLILVSHIDLGKEFNVRRISL